MNQRHILAITDRHQPLPDNVAHAGAAMQMSGDFAIIEARMPRTDKRSQEVAAQRRQQFHHQILESLMAAGMPLIATARPVVIQDRQALDSALDAHRLGIARALASLGRKAQFEIRAMAEPKQLIGELAEQGALQELEGLPPEAIAVALRSKLEAYKGHLASKIRSFFAQIGDHQSMPPCPVNGVLFQAFIMGDRSIEAGLDIALERAGEALNGRFGLHCLGPLPARHFVRIELDEVTAARLRTARTRLGLDQAEPDRETVQAAFRDAAGKLHPDLKAGGQADDDETATELAKLKSARQRLLRWLDRKNDAGDDATFVDCRIVTPQTAVAQPVRAAA